LKIEVPEGREMKEHLKVAIHITSVSLIDQTQVVLTKVFLLSDSESDEEVRVNWRQLEPASLFPIFFGQGFPNRLDVLGGGGVVAEPGILAVHYDPKFNALVHDHVLRESQSAADIIVFSN
jgi:hypothetical protein